MNNENQIERKRYDKAFKRELQHVSRQRGIQKMLASCGQRERFERIKAMNDHYSISELCETFDVSRSG